MKKLYTVLTFLSVILTVQNTNSFGQATPAILTYTTVGTTTYTVPAGVASLTITAKGGKGGTNGDSTSHLNTGGAGACAVATYTVTPGLVANIYVGGRGDNGVPSAGGPTNGGFNGGGKGQFITSSVSGGGGGGASDVRFSGTALSDRVIVGAGGGGAGSACGAHREDGGIGGGYTGAAGLSTCPTIAPSVGGGGATTGAPGAGGTATGSGSPGSPGVVGIGGNGGSSTSGGGGGGGYYGGGGGQFGGGGGGSSYTGTGTSASATANCNLGGGVVTIQENCIPQTITATRTQICPYETLTLSDNVSGGTWSSANPAVGTIDPTTGVFSGTFPGSPVVQTVAITYTAGPCKLSFTVTVNPLPATITGSKAICSGLTSQLSNATPAGTWSSSGVGSVDAFGLLSGTTGASPGTGTVTYTEPVHGCYITAPTIVNPLPAPITGTFQACVGLTQTLSDATPGGTFSNVNPFLTGVAGNVVTGLAFGVDTIIYTLTATGCVATHEFTVNPLPATPIGASAICQGNTTTLNDVDGPGTWSTSATAASVVSGTGVVTGLNVGLAQSTAIITYTLNTTGCINTFVVSVNPLPVNTYSMTPTTGHYCAGTLGVDVQLSNTQLGFQYDLYNGATLVTTLLGGGGPLDFGLQLLGTYHVVATDTRYPTGCTSNMTGVANIIEDPLPNPISGASGVCAGSTTTLSDAGGGTWASSDPSIATINSSGVVTGVALSRGTVTITYTLPVTGCIMTKTMTIAPNYPIYGITTACNGGTISLSDTSDFSFGGGAWSGIGVTVVGTGSTATVTKTAPGTGTGTVSYISSAGCVATTTVTFTPLDPITGPVPAMVCEGSVITLANPNAGGTWSSSATCAATVDVSGNVTGISSTLCASTATITYTLPTGCAATLTVTINPTPAPISGTAVTCPGLTSGLSDALGGGVWSNSCTTLFTVSSSGVVTALTAGTCTISYTMPVTGCQATITYTVNPLPNPITGTAAVCQGYGTTFSATPTPGTWSSSLPGVGSIDPATGVFVGRTPGTTTITYTLPTGCIITQTATVNPVPAIPVITVGKDTLCGGSSITLSDATAGGVWSTLSGGVISTITSPPPVLTGTFVGAGGVDSVFYTTASGCRSAKGIFVRTLNAIAGPAKMCVGQTTLFTELATGGTWSSSNPAIGSVDALGNVTARTPGIITIKDTFATGCFVTMTVTVYALPTAIIGTPVTICNFGTTTLSDATTGGTWSASGDATVDAAGVVTGANILGGTATITYTVTISGCTAIGTVSVLPLDSIHGPSSICYGSSATLTDGTAGGTWSSSDVTIATIGSTSGVISAGTIIPPGGVVTVTYTTTLGCQATKSFTVNPIGNITPVRVCLNSSVTLTDNIAGGGTWSSISTTIALGSSTGVVTGTTVGTALISYTIAATGCVNAISFIIDPIPAPITGDFEICKGTTTVLSDADAFGTWSSSITTIGTIDPTTGTAGGVNAGTTTITYKFTITGCYTTASLVVDDVKPIAGNLGVCVGLTTTLSDAIAGGTWSNSCASIFTVGSSSGVVSGVAQGTCTITYTNPNGCISLATVTVSPLPNAITGSPFVVCRGQTITVSNSTAGGNWSSSGNISVSPATGSSTVVTGTAAGTGTVTYTTGAGCIATQVVTVNALSPIVTAPFRVCIGSSITLSDATTGGTWARGTGQIDIDLNTGVVTTNSLGTSIVTYTTSAGCLAFATVTVNPLPTSIFGTSAVCQGSTVTLTDATSGGVWSSTGSVSVVGAGTTGTVTGVAGPGTGTISYTLPTTCAATYVVTVNPLPGPITGTRSICVGAGNSTTLTDLTAGGTWSSSNIGVGTIGTVTSNSAQVVSVGVVGTTTISYTLSSTGCATTAIVSVNPFPAAITGPTQVCVNSTITVSNSLSTGVWSITPGARATITPAVPPFSAVIFGVSAGTATISYSFPTGCAATQTLTVLPQPLAFITPIGDTNICPGSFVALTANTGTSLSYQWYDAAGYSIIPGAISSSYIAAPPAVTRYAVKVTDGTTGCSDTSVAMMVSPIPTSASITFSPATTVCAGTVVTLTASGIAATGYQWEVGGTPIAGATAVTYTPTVTGSYDAVVTNATGCSAKSSTVSITINPTPLGTITVTGPATFCDGDSVLLSGESGTGLTYQWRNVGGPIPGATNMTYYAKLGDDYRVSVTNSSGCNAISGIVTVTVKALPTGAAITASPSLVFCTGGSVTFNATSDADLFIPAATYTWYENGLPVGTTGPNLKTTTSGRYKALVTDPATGCSVFTPEDTAVLVVTPIIAPVSSASFCWGGSAALKAVIVGGITPTYQWYIGGVPIAGATSGVYPAVKGGSYTVKITSTCSTTSLPIDVTENPLPNPLLTFDGAKIATQKYYVSYQWFKDLTAISGATKYNLVPSTNGKYKVSVTDTNGCQSISDYYILTGWAPHVNGVQTLGSGEIRVYPNPAQNMIHIESATEVRAVITSIDGRVLIEQSKAKDIDIKTLANGIYTIMLYDTDGQMVKAEKLVKAAE